jgi:hypothetical protein
MKRITAKIDWKPKDIQSIKPSKLALNCYELLLKQKEINFFPKNHIPIIVDDLLHSLEFSGEPLPQTITKKEDYLVILISLNLKKKLVTFEGSLELNLLTRSMKESKPGYFIIPWTLVDRKTFFSKSIHNWVDKKTEEMKEFSFDLDTRNLVLAPFWKEMNFQNPNVCVEDVKQLIQIRYDFLRELDILSKSKDRIARTIKDEDEVIFNKNFIKTMQDFFEKISLHGSRRKRILYETEMEGSNTLALSADALNNLSFWMLLTYVSKSVHCEQSLRNLLMESEKMLLREQIKLFWTRDQNSSKRLSQKLEDFLKGLVDFRIETSQPKRDTGCFGQSATWYVTNFENVLERVRDRSVLLHKGEAWFKPEDYLCFVTSLTSKEIEKIYSKNRRLTTNDSIADIVLFGDAVASSFVKQMPTAVNKRKRIDLDFQEAIKPNTAPPCVLNAIERVKSLKAKHPNRLLLGSWARELGFDDQTITDELVNISRKSGSLKKTATDLFKADPYISLNKSHNGDFGYGCKGLIENTHSCPIEESKGDIEDLLSEKYPNLNSSARGRVVKEAKKGSRLGCQCLLENMCGEKQFSRPSEFTRKIVGVLENLK